MPQSAEISVMMQGYAEQAVALAREFKIDLDYSEDSVEQVERLLGQLQGDLAQWQMGKSSKDTKIEGEPLDEMSRIWGGYLGEVVRRRFGGDWSIENYPGGDFLIIALNVGDSRLFPAMKVHKRLTEGVADNLWTFYQMMREKLLARPGAKIQ